MLVLENELLRVSVLLDKGADIYEFLYKPKDIDFMWRSPQELPDPGVSRPSSAREDGFFMDHYHGGWQEIFPNGGRHCTYKGAELGQHGEVALLPWRCRIEVDTPDEVAVRLWVRTVRTPFFVEKTLRLKSGVGALFIDERIVNEGREDMEFMWGHHPALGGSFLDDTCRIDAPATRVEVHSPLGATSRLEAGAVFESFPVVTDKMGAAYDLSKIPPHGTGTSEMVYLLGLEEGWYAVTNTSREVGFGMSWDRDIFPVVWLWEEFGGGQGYPWYGRTYNIALEPFNSWPGGMDTALARGNCAKIAAGSEVCASLVAVAYEGMKKVSGISRDGKVSGE